MLDIMMKKMMNSMMDDKLNEMLTSEYSNNIFAMMTMMQKLTPRPIMEAGMRAETGKPLARPLGSPIVHFHWDQLLLSPKQLFELPTADLNSIETKTVIGPKSARPLKLDIPILVTGMSLGGSLSIPMKTALAKGAAKAGTATNTGESVVTPYERDNAKYLIGQFHRGGWVNPLEQLNQVDAIEVQFGQGAFGGAVTDALSSDKIDKQLEEIWGLQDGEDAVIRARFPDINSSEDIINLVNSIKKKYPVPVGVKIAASDYIELELEVIAKTDADFVTIDGSEGGTAGTPPTLQDSVGLPTLHALVRTVDYLEKEGVKDRISLLIAGGLKTPGDFLKALALGADAIYIGSIALMATMQSQMTKALPEDPPPQIALYKGKLKDELDVEAAAENLSNFFKSSVAEMKLAAQALGKNSLQELNRSDLVSVDKELAEFAQVRYAMSARKG